MALLSERSYYLGFSKAPVIGPLRFKLLKEYFGNAEKAWNVSYQDLVGIHLGELSARRFIDFRDNFSIEKFVHSLEEQDIDFVSQSDKTYPKLLKQITDPPIVLYVRGKIPFDEGGESQALAVVGTRAITHYGREVTERLTVDLVKRGFVIVSGMAYGVDTVAHWAAIHQDGKTIAVLGNGIDIIYPPSNAHLYETIIKGCGAVISEYPPGTGASRGSFPARNRIISGMSLGVVVTEGAMDSGSLITARLAAEQGREVFAVPGPITSSLSKGPIKLIKQGAKLVTEVDDILEELKMYHKVERSFPAMKKIPFSLSANEQKILSFLGRENLHTDELIIKTGLHPGEIASVLSMLEMNGIIRSFDDGTFGLTT